MEILKQGELPLQELATLLRADVRDVIEDLEHIRRSVRPQRLVLVPASCRNCGFVFKERSRAKTPSKCPRCRQERIEPAKYRIV